MQLKYIFNLLYIIKLFKLLKNNQVLLESPKEKEIRKLSKKCLNLKGIDKCFNFEDPLIRTRVCYGFLEKKNPNDYIDIFQNRWLFMISSRPITDIGLANDDITINPQDYKDHNFKFNTLYYFEVNNDKDHSHAKGFIDLK